MKLILDTDFGYMNDDALALPMLTQLEKAGKAEILGVTLTGGNNFITASYTDSYEEKQGALSYLTSFLEQIGRTDIPIYEGIEYPYGYSKENEKDFESRYRYYTDTDGTEKERTILSDSYGALWHLDDYRGCLADKDDAADFMISMAEKYAGELVIVAIGPSCNIARAVEKDPEFARKVGAVYVMSGAFGEPVPTHNTEGKEIQTVPGANVTNFTEYNVAFDPAAFSVLLSAGFSRLVITSGSCNAYVPTDLAERLRSAIGDTGNPTAKLWTEYHENNTQDWPYWDPMTVYAMVCPEKILKSADGYVTVETDEANEEFGRTRLLSQETYDSLSEEQKSHRSKAMVVDCMEGFYDYLIPLLTF